MIKDLRMKQNVLFILVDCLRADKCYGDKRSAKTPNIESLIRNGVFFSKTIATTTTTTPSVASIFTGLYTFAHGIRSLKGYKLSNNVKTLAEVFKENGYNTYAEVTGPLVPYAGIDRGFDNYCCRDKKEYFIDKWGDGLIQKFKDGHFKEPWFIFLHLWELHDPRRIANGFNNARFGKNRYERALSGLDVKLGELFKCMNKNTAIIIHGDHGEKIIETMLVEYLYDLKQIAKKTADRMKITIAGITRKAFKLLGINGEKLPEFAKQNYSPKLKRPARFRLFGHGFHVYDSALVIPLIISGDNGKFPKNMVISTQVRQVDIFPTLIDGFELRTITPLNSHGQSLSPLLRGEKFNELPAYSEACGKVLADKKYWKISLRTNKYKFICRPYHTDKKEELYNLESDPLEKNNIIQSQGEIANALKKQLLEIRKSDLKEIELRGQIMNTEEDNLLTSRLKELGYL